MPHKNPIGFTKEQRIVGTASTPHKPQTPLQVPSQLRVQLYLRLSRGVPTTCPHQPSRSKPASVWLLLWQIAGCGSSCQPHNQKTRTQCTAVQPLLPPIYQPSQPPSTSIGGPSGPASGFPFLSQPCNFSATAITTSPRASCAMPDAGLSS